MEIVALVEPMSCKRNQLDRALLELRSQCRCQNLVAPLEPLEDGAIAGAETKLRARAAAEQGPGAMRGIAGIGYFDERRARRNDSREGRHHAQRLRRRQYNLSLRDDLLLVLFTACPTFMQAAQNCRR